MEIKFRLPTRYADDETSSSSSTKQHTLCVFLASSFRAGHDQEGPFPWRRQRDTIQSATVRILARLSVCLSVCLSLTRALHSIARSTGSLAISRSQTSGCTRMRSRILTTALRSWAPSQPPMSTLNRSAAWGECAISSSLPRPRNITFLHHSCRDDSLTLMCPLMTVSFSFRPCPHTRVSSAHAFQVGDPRVHERRWRASPWKILVVSGSEGPRRAQGDRCGLWVA